jgi:hypothetical protein
MARPKSNSDALQKLTLRVNGLKTIKTDLNSTTISVKTGEDLKKRLQTTLDDYNIRQSRHITIANIRCSRCMLKNSLRC